MNNTYNLSQSERVYLGHVGTTRTINLSSKANEPSPAKRVTGNSKGAGRKPLDEPVKAERIEQRRDAVVNQRKQLDESRRERKQSKQEFEQQRREKMKVVLNDREKLQSLQNRAKNTAVAAVDATNEDLPEGCTIAGGIYAKKGTTAVRINHKTVINVRYGYSILDAIEKHLLHQKLQLAI